MCTVTFIPLSKNNFVLTSNRDEAPNRMTIPPQEYALNTVNALFPKDERAGGTWIGSSAHGRTLCVLNGGFTYHEREENYRMSRGVIVKQLLDTPDLKTAIQELDLEGVEPFTLVIVDHSTTLKLSQLVWDGSTKHYQVLGSKPTIWSSSSLYSDAMKKERHQWFFDFINDNELDEKSILQFHKTAGANNLEYGVIMDRLFVKTTSITQVVKRESQVKMTFNHLDPQQVSTTLNLLNIVEE